jgi:hypothetical protein
MVSEPTMQEVGKTVPFFEWTSMDKTTGILLRMFCLFFVFCAIDPCTAFAFRNVRKVKAIEFRGLKYLSKYEIINGSITRVEDDYFVVDIDSLSSLLKKNQMIASYRIAMEGENVKIAIVENEPAFLLCVRKKKRMVFFELDRGFKVISYMRVHAYDKPLIIISEEDIDGGKLSERVIRLLRLLQDLQADNVRIYDEISEIELCDLDSVRLRLRGRKTECIMSPTWKSFNRLNYVVAYLDRIKYYPDVLRLFCRFVIIR